MGDYIFQTGFMFASEREQRTLAISDYFNLVSEIEVIRTEPQSVGGPV